jgi:hypothetical protein
VIVYTHKITPRLRFITDFIGKEITGKPFVLTDDVEVFKNYNGPKINYSNSRISDDELIINNSLLLFETTIKEQDVACFETNGFKAFFKTTGDYPFDVFAASFYLLSRYEEYLPHKKDMYGRYAHENSLAYKEGFLDLPLVNIWVEDFKKVLKEKFPQLTIHYSRFTFQPTYDIDEAYSYKHKGWLRTLGGSLKSIVSGEWSTLSERMKVLNGRLKDPFDSFDEMDALHEKHHLKPIYFFLVPASNARYDKNILPSQPAMQQLIKRHAEKYPVAIHPSWQSGDDESLLEKEIETLETITGKKITASRQHYIRFTLPEGYRRLIRNGITGDYSMGYGSINGFRASVASEFYWYDLEKDETTQLLLHPWCFMEANSFFEQKHSPEQAFEEMLHYYHAVKSVNGTLITLWHNTFLGTAQLYAGWGEQYRKFIETISSPKV